MIGADDPIAVVNIERRAKFCNDVGDGNLLDGVLTHGCLAFAGQGKRPRAEPDEERSYMALGWTSLSVCHSATKKEKEIGHYGGGQRDDSGRVADKVAFRRQVAVFISLKVVGATILSVVVNRAGVNIWAEVNRPLTGRRYPL